MQLWVQPSWTKVFESSINTLEQRSPCIRCCLRASPTYPNNKQSKTSSKQRQPLFPKTVLSEYKYQISDPNPLVPSSSPCTNTHNRDHHVPHHKYSSAEPQPRLTPSASKLLVTLKMPRACEVWIANEIMAVKWNHLNINDMWET